MWFRGDSIKFILQTQSKNRHMGWGRCQSFISRNPCILLGKSSFLGSVSVIPSLGPKDKVLLLKVTLGNGTSEFMGLIAKLG